MTNRNELVYKPIELILENFLANYVKRVKVALSDFELKGGSVNNNWINSLMSVNCYASLNVIGNVQYSEVSGEDIEDIIIGIGIYTPMSYYNGNSISYSKIRSDNFKDLAKYDSDFDISRIEYLNGKTAFIELDVSGYGECIQDVIIEMPTLRVNESSNETFRKDLNTKINQTLNLLDENFNKVVTGIKRIVTEIKTKHNKT